MVLCTFCPLIIPFLALSSITGIHPVREPASSSVGVVTMTSAEGSGSMQHLAHHRASHGGPLPGSGNNLCNSGTDDFSQGVECQRPLV
jgi:hypothetical protein